LNEAADLLRSKNIVTFLVCIVLGSFFKKVNGGKYTIISVTVVEVGFVR
jgi:hypothetical protein